MTTLSEYQGYSYGIPFAFLVPLLLYMGVFGNYRSVYFIVDIVLGIRRIPRKVSDVSDFPSTTNQQQSEITNNTKTTCCIRSISAIARCCVRLATCHKNRDEDVSLYLHIERDEAIKFNGLRRTYCCLLTILILTVLFTFIYESCIVSNATVKIGDWCPDYEAECFDANSSILVFNCTPYQKVSFTTNSSYVRCFGWVYDQMTTRKVMDAIGVCGGLLGIISCVIPWTYHLSYYENQPWKAWLWFWVPLLPLGALIAIGAVSSTRKWAPPSTLTVISFSVISGLAGGAWGFAYYSAKNQKSKVSPDTETGQSPIPPQTTIQVSD